MAKASKTKAKAKAPEADVLEQEDQDKQVAQALYEEARQYQRAFLGELRAIRKELELLRLGTTPASIPSMRDWGTWAELFRVQLPSALGIREPGIKKPAIQHIVAKKKVDRAIQATNR